MSVWGFSLDFFQLLHCFRSFLPLRNIFKSNCTLSPAFLRQFSTLDCDFYTYSWVVLLNSREYKFAFAGCSTEQLRVIREFPLWTVANISGSLVFLSQVFACSLLQVIPVCEWCLFMNVL